MAVELWIDDGNPWYLSPDIWVVPSDDPGDPPGLPFANVSAYVWARVHNRGSTAVSNATVRFYWADPSTVITPTTATLIGTSSASLTAGETKEVLCVTPWIPSFVNNGHECLIAQAFAPSDPAPPQGPNDPFNVPADRHLAQRNITVGAAMARMARFVHPFRIGNPMRFRTGEVLVRARRAPVEILKPLLRNLGLRELPAEAEGFEEFALQPYRCGQEIHETGKPDLRIAVSPGHQEGLVLVARVPDRFKAGTAALVLIEQIVEDKPLGGMAVLIVPAKEDRTTVKKG
ncbi:MAG: hypothetical protein EHM18_03550 [Acidobacteria bacterium]|nr:MAG: hypothetical protein EHM18_03550 [Acidobacteriota bacterium]